jgi:hypothetical protein
MHATGKQTAESRRRSFAGCNRRRRRLTSGDRHARHSTLAAGVTQAEINKLSEQYFICLRNSSIVTAARTELPKKKRARKQARFMRR